MTIPAAQSTVGWRTVPINAVSYVDTEIRAYTILVCLSALTHPTLFMISLYQRATSGLIKGLTPPHQNDSYAAEPYCRCSAGYTLHYTTAISHASICKHMSPYSQSLAAVSYQTA